MAGTPTTQALCRRATGPHGGLEFACCYPCFCFNISSLNAMMLLLRASLNAMMLLLRALLQRPGTPGTSSPVIAKISNKQCTALGGSMAIEGPS